MMEIVEMADGVLEIRIKSLGIVTHAKKLESDVSAAIGEAVILYHAQRKNLKDTSNTVRVY